MFSMKMEDFEGLVNAFILRKLSKYHIDYLVGKIKFWLVNFTEAILELVYLREGSTNCYHDVY